MRGIRRRGLRSDQVRASAAVGEKTTSTTIPTLEARKRGQGRCSVLTPQIANFDGLIDLLTERVADRVAAKLAAARSPESDRVTKNDDATLRALGVPSWRWIEDAARAGRIAIHGPRGGRYVLRAALEALLSASTIRRARTTARPVASADDDAPNIVAELAARREGGAR